MKIGVLSDTHLPYAVKNLPQKVKDVFADVDIIIHAGDFQDIGVIKTLSALGTFYGVCGNMDPPEIRKLLPEKKILRLAGFSIGVIHGWGSPQGLETRIASAFAEETLDAIIFGHSHCAVNKTKDGVIFFNPGSPTDTRFAKANSVGILTLKENITGEIVKI